MLRLTREQFNGLPRREQQALLRLNEYAWRVSGRARRPNFRDLMAAIKAIRYLGSKHETRTRYFDGDTGFSAVIRDAERVYLLETLDCDAADVDPARFVRGARRHAMMLDSATLLEKEATDA